MLSRQSSIHSTRIFAAVCLCCLLTTLSLSGKTRQTRRPHRATTVLNLRDYGALGDGLADDGPALQQALDELANAGGGSLEVPAGHYLLQTPVIGQFSPGSAIAIVGEPSATPIDVAGNGSGLDLTSEFIIAIGETNDAIKLTGSAALSITDVGFVGIQDVGTDARTVLTLTDIGQTTIHHCEFYGLASLVAGGAIVEVNQADLKLEQTAFLGCAADSGQTTSIVHTNSWLGIAITDCKFIDYGNRPNFFSKTPIAPPYSWIFIGTAAALVPNWSRREAIIRNVFLDEGAWMGIAARPDLFDPVFPPYEVYLSRLYVNVTNLGGCGVYLYGARKAFIEQSHFGWSHNAGAAINLSGVGEAILDLNECVEDANTIHVEAERLAVINSTYTNLESTAPYTRIINTDTADQDPAQYVRQQYLASLKHDPDPAGHFYWTDQIVRCESNLDCVGQVQNALAAFLTEAPLARFSLSGQVLDETGAPLAAVTVSLTGSQEVATETDANGLFIFSNLATAGRYVLTPAKTHYTFESQQLETPTSDQMRNFTGARNGHAISGRVFANTGLALPGATLTLSGAQDDTTISDANGDFTFPNLSAGGDYVVTIARNNYFFESSSYSITNLSADQSLVFGGVLLNYTIAGRLAKADGTPINGVVVTLSGGVGTSQTTGPTGAYSFTVHGEDDYTVSVSLVNYAFSPATQTFTNLSVNQNANFDGALIDFVVSGRVTTNDGAQLSGVTLTASGTETEAVVTDHNSNYSLNLEAEGDYILTPSKPNYAFLPASVAVNDLAGHRTLNFIAYLNAGVPVLLAGPDPARAVALDAVLRTTEPFKLQYDYPWVADRRTRVMLFATHFELLPGEGATSLTATVEDNTHRSYPLTVEYAAKVEEVPSLTCIVVRLSDDLTDVGDVLVRVNYRGLSSEPMLIGIGHVTQNVSLRVR